MRLEFLLFLLFLPLFLLVSIVVISFYRFNYKKYGTISPILKIRNYDAGDKLMDYLEFKSKNKFAYYLDKLLRPLALVFFLVFGCLQFLDY